MWVGFVNLRIDGFCRFLKIGIKLDLFPRFDSDRIRKWLIGGSSMTKLSHTVIIITFHWAQILCCYPAWSLWLGCDIMSFLWADRVPISSTHSSNPSRCTTIWLIWAEIGWLPSFGPNQFLFHVLYLLLFPFWDFGLVGMLDYICVVPHFFSQSTLLFLTFLQLSLNFLFFFFDFLVENGFIVFDSFTWGNDSWIITSSTCRLNWFQVFWE